MKLTGIIIMAACAAFLLLSFCKFTKKRESSMDHYFEGPDENISK
jgi:hypothetical protein